MNKIVIYTAIFGKRDILLEPELVPKGVDFICFTDNRFDSDIWKVINIKPPVSNDLIRSARKIKILPHEFLNGFDVSIWVDGNIVVRGDVNEAVSKYLKNHNMAVYNHNYTKGDTRACIYQEARALIDMGRKGKIKESEQIIKEQISVYRDVGYPENNGLLSSMILFRRHNEKEVKEVMNLWWEQIVKFSNRDQLSFNYAAWKNDFSFLYINEDSRSNSYFYQVKHSGQAAQPIYFKFLNKLRILNNKINVFKQ